mgnify:CR=1 FL=1
MNNITIIIPCFNEEKRLKYKDFIDFSNNNKINFFFINDGSSDGTKEVIEKILSKTQNNSLLNLDYNVGKAEAIRIGMLKAIKKFDSNIFGYWDADLATPLSEIIYLLKYFKTDETVMVFGSRFKRLGNNIQRNAIRHYFGRIIATFISMILNMGVYDTQCGAKIINKKFIKEIFTQPFYTKWLFDVEIFFRIKQFTKEKKIIEIPLNTWSDIANSKITILDFAKTPFNLLKIILKYRFNKNYFNK